MYQNNISKIILIGNYIPDKQESMLRFGNMLNDGFLAKGLHSEIWYPTVFFGKLVNSTNQGFKKWIGYLDKYIIFPIVLFVKLRQRKYQKPDVYFHICDHSNSPYLKYLSSFNTSITCHDVLAIRGAMGYKDAYAPASKFGKILQNWILKHLTQAKTLAAVSHFSLEQLKDLSKISSIKNTNNRHWVVVHNAFNASFWPMKPIDYAPLLQNMGLSIDEPFILHVGTAHPRKNRIILVRVLNKLKHNWLGKLCLASKALDKDLLKLAEQLGVMDRIVSVVRPDHEHLVALYSACEAFLFPSLSEGFGWPVIEAQACGAAVVASKLDPMPEVSGNAALHEDPLNAQALASAFLSLRNQDIKDSIINNGFKNIKRFDLNIMINAYLNLFTRKN